MTTREGARGRIRAAGRPGRRAAGPPRAPTPSSPSPYEAFGERLGALERAVEEALAESGTSVSGGSWTAEAIELVLERWAQLGRAFESGTLGDVLPLAGGSTLGESDEFGHHPGIEGAVAAVLRVLCRAWWRVDAVGLDALPAEGRVLLVANRAATIFPVEAAVLKLVVRDQHPSARTVRPLIDPAMVRLPLVGDLLARCGYVAASSRNAERLLERELAVLLFPEGASGRGKLYRDRYRLGPFARGGVVRLALRTGTPILPVAIIGADEAHPVIGRWDGLGRWLGLPGFPLTPTFPWLGALGLIPLPSRWRIELGEPIDWRAEHGPDAAGDARLVRRLTAETRRRLQDLVAGAHRRRGPAFL
jgi:1-acyl-sn-glycerol-3-phosphate acyltransferase